MERNPLTPLDRALNLLGPLEGRIMRAIWTGAVQEPFVVRDIQALMPELAYTTVMTTLNRLADKGILRVRRVRQQRAHAYRAAGSPETFLARESKDQVERVVEQFGEAAMVAFAEQLDGLSPEQLECLRGVGRR